MNLGRRSVLGLVAGAVAFQSHAQPSTPVDGRVVARSSNEPVPGLRAELLHQQLGRSAPSYTDSNGRFGWAAVPLHQEPYYLEIYWGQTLKYRRRIAVNGPVSLLTITL